MADSTESDHRAVSGRSGRERPELNRLLEIEFKSERMLGDDVNRALLARLHRLILKTRLNRQFGEGMPPDTFYARLCKWSLLLTDTPCARVRVNYNLCGHAASEVHARECPE